MELWIVLSWKGSVRITEFSSAVESRQILQALEGALHWGFVRAGLSSWGAGGALAVESEGLGAF